MNWDSDGEKAFAEAAFIRVSEAAEPILKRKLEAIGTPFEALPRAQQTELLKSTMVEATATLNPDADFDGLRRVFDMMGDVRFTSAMGRVRALPYGGAFDPAIGQDAALILSGAGLAIQPMDRKTGRPFAELAYGIDQADRIFSKAKTAWVGYRPAEAPFYVLVTDCVLTAYKHIKQNPAFADLKRKMETGYGGFPPQPGVPQFKHGLLLFAREPGDQIETLVIEDPSPERGSVMLLAGWKDGDHTEGVPNDGVLSVPEQLVRQLITDPQVLQWITRPVGQVMTMSLH